MELLCQPFICSRIGIGAFFPRFQSSLRPSVSIGYRQHPVFGIASLIASLTLITVEVSRNEGRGDNFWIATETDPVPDVDEIFVCISKDINARADGWVIRFVAPGAVLWHERPMLSAEVRHFFHVQDKLRLAMTLIPFHRGFYPNLVRSAFAGNGVTAAGSFFVRFSHKSLLFLPFGNHGVGALGDVVFNSCWVFALICFATMLWQAALSKRRRLHIP